MTFRNLLMLASATAVLAACNSSETPVDQADGTAPLPVLTPTPTPTSAPDGTAIVAGSWQVGEDATGARATYAAEGASPSLTIACDTRTRAVTLTLADAEPGSKSYAVEAGGQLARLDMNADGAQAVSAEIDPTLALFAAFSQADTAIGFTDEAGAKQQYPTHPGIQRVFYACL